MTTIRTSATVAEAAKYLKMLIGRAIDVADKVDVHTECYVNLEELPRQKMVITIDGLMGMPPSPPSSS